MKKIYIPLILFISFFLHNCIGEDIIEDAVTEEIRFLNPVESIAMSGTHQIDTRFFNSVGEEQDVDIDWSSEDPLIATVDDNGLVTGISEGSTNIVARASLDNTIVENKIFITITSDGTDTVSEVVSKSGTIVTTSSYVLAGDFTLSELMDSDNLELTLADNYEASTRLPGLYVYLSNNPNSIANAFEIGAVETFNGAHSYTLENKGINDYSYVLYWCKPFGVKVGEGIINN